MASYDEYKSYIRITWDRMDEATHYRILRNVDGAWLEVANNVKIGKDFNFGLYWDQPYENETLYGVQACNGAGCSDVNTHDCGSTMPGSI